MEEKQERAALRRILVLAVLVTVSGDSTAEHGALWARTDAQRFDDIAVFAPALFNYPVRDDTLGFHAGMRFRKRAGYASTLAHALNATAASRRIFLDLGARSPRSSIAEFRASYPGAASFEVHAFEADESFAAEYAARPDVRLWKGVVSTRDEDCFFSDRSSVVAHASRKASSTQTRPARCFDFRRWLLENVPPDAFVVAKIDIEGTEFDLIPHLLAEGGDALRLIDEVYIECHHVETWGNGPHRFAECLDMMKRLRDAGLFVHEWF